MLKQLNDEHRPAENRPKQRKSASQSLLNRPERFCIQALLILRIITDF